MRRRLAPSWMLALGLALLPASGFAPVLAQEVSGGTPGEVGEWMGDGLYVAALDGSPDASGPDQAAAIVTFDHGAYIPEQEYPMAVARVLSGEFAFRVLGDVILAPPDVPGTEGGTVAILAAKPEIPPGTLPEPARDFLEVGTIDTGACPVGVAGAAGPPTTLCLLNPDVLDRAVGAEGPTPGAYFVRLTAGDTVVVPAGTQCLVCNVTGATGGSAAASADRAQLVVYTSRGFDWAGFARGPAAASGTATPAAAGPGGIRALALHPGSPCH